MCACNGCPLLAAALLTALPQSACLPSCLQLDYDGAGFDEGGGGGGGGGEGGSGGEEDDFEAQMRALEEGL